MDHPNEAKNLVLINKKKLDKYWPLLFQKIRKWKVKENEKLDEYLEIARGL